MGRLTLEKVTRLIEDFTFQHAVGRVQQVSGGTLQVAGFPRSTRLGDRISLQNGAETLRGEIIRLQPDHVDVLVDGSVEGVALNTRVILVPRPRFAPDISWIGRVVDPDGAPLDGRPLLPGLGRSALQGRPNPPNQRRPLGERLETGLAAMNTMLPLVQGQRVGLFAGSGVGKSTLLADLARGVNADVIVIALVGERGREVRHFTESVLGPEGMKRAVVIAATSDAAPQVRRRCAWAATAVAEFFRDQGLQVLLLCDSVTRFCEAHREVAVAAGEETSLRGFPPSTGSAIAALCERAGPGKEESGDITAIYTVLVAGSDMEEPVADMLRGILDGHIVLDRQIAEQGRFPAIDILRSVSRALPDAATPLENSLILQARRRMGTYDKAALMIQAGLYETGSDSSIDAAIKSQSAIEKFLALRDGKPAQHHFALLRQALNTGGPNEEQGEPTRPAKA
ncbi:flagellum-specific ATP synthase [Cognatiyoonia koreensis]|uniref:Flagellum-specific ATP synthase n=1 Tax=Cognatiyoonia koreensis TaxID=364200 RepID=A0A1I0RJQ1_9RHOB|nr:FliI/YscN family ATPase [Cognatiyoonia koreensis]SEW41225.1 flagellum-specific ATP synthase [Cognatiyoonia koreensis]